MPTQEITPQIDRRHLERVIPKIGVRSLRSAVTDTSGMPDGLLKYPELARRFHTRWLNTLTTVTSDELYPESAEDKRIVAEAVSTTLRGKESNTYKGFTVTGEVLGMTVGAYKRLRGPGNRSVEELVEIQKNQDTITKTVLMLANRPDEANKRVEEALCLYDGAYDLAVQDERDITFLTLDRDEEGLHFVPNMIRVLQEAGVESLTLEGGSCPAQRFIPILWTSMVDYCAADPRFYETDLNQ